MADAAGASSPFLTEHADIIGWLDVLLKGKSEEQARARTEIAMILEERGFADDAEEAYWTNVQAKSADRRAYERLIALYQERKDRLSESLVRRQLDDVFSAAGQPAPVIPGAPAAPTAAHVAMPPTPEQPARPIRRLRSAQSTPASYTPERPDNPRLGAPATQTAAPPAAAPRPVPAATQILPETTGPADTPDAPRAVPRPADRPLVPSASRAQAVPLHALTPAGTQPAQPDEIISADLTGTPRSRRRAVLLPNPGGHRFRLSTGGLIALQPMTILAFLLASFGAAAIISFLLIAFDRGGAKTANAAPLQVPARCVDGAARFPGASDPRAAVVAAYKQQGIDVDAPKPGGPRLTAEQADLVVGGWMATSLLLEHAGQPAPTLVQWLDPGSDKSTLANAILSGRGLDSMLTTQEWADARTWPATNCEGAFLKDPRNAGLVKLIERVAAK